MSDEIEKPVERPAHEASLREPVDEPAKASVPVYVGVGLLIAALLVVLLVVNSRSTIFSRTEKNDPSVSAASAELEAMRADLNRQRMSMGLRPIESGSEAIDDIAKRLTKDAETIVALANSFQGMLAEKDAALDAKNSELIRSEKLRQSLVAESSRLQAELQRSLVANADGELANRELAGVKDQRDRLAAALAAAEKEIKAMGGGRSEADFSVLERRLEEAQRAKDFFEKRARELEDGAAKPGIFAKSEGELLPAAVELYRTLKRLEGKKDSELTTAYSEVGVNLGSNVVHTLGFQTGSSELSTEEQSTLRQLVETVPDGDLVLIVGYASETGNVDNNRSLSSDRATAVAEYFSSVKRAGQLVQGVYLGQTDRFSSRIPERNQLCEIWHIRRK